MGVGGQIIFASASPPLMAVLPQVVFAPQPSILPVAVRMPAHAAALQRRLIMNALSGEMSTMWRYKAARRECTFDKREILSASPLDGTGSCGGNTGCIGGAGGVGGGNGSVRAKSSSGKLQEIVIAKAVRGDAREIIELIELQRTYNVLRQMNVNSSERGFLLAQITESEYENLIRTEDVWIAKSDKTTVGVLFATRAGTNRYEYLPNHRVDWVNKSARLNYETNNYLYLWIIAVHPGFHSKGIGKQLVSALISQVRSRNAAAIITDFMNTPILNKQSEAFFKSAGFHFAGTLGISDYYGAGDSSWQIYYSEVR